MLKPQDILVALKLVALGNERWTYASLAESLGLSVSETHSAVKRGLESRLLTRYNPAFERVEKPLPALGHLEKLLVHGLPYLMPRPRGGEKICMGTPTADAHPMFDAKLFTPEGYLPPVWPEPRGKVRGRALKPLHRNCARAAKNDPRLYELLALLDALRGSTARITQAARELLEQRFKAAYSERVTLARSAIEP